MTPISKLHQKIKDEVEKVRDETGAFVGYITITWGEGDDGRKITEVTCTMGTSSKYEDKKKDD